MKPHHPDDTIRDEQVEMAGPGLSLPRGGERYQAQKVLGRGSMGEVSIARDLYLLRRVAFKRMNPHVAQDPRLASRFLSEAQVTAQLDHPNIIPIYGLEVGADGSVGYAMKLIEGKNLSQLIQEAQAALPQTGSEREPHLLADRLRIFTRICDAMAHAHEKGVLHRDLKPDNIMIGRFNQVHVVDWGICRLLHRPDDPAAELAPSAEVGGTMVGAMLGTPSYMSPEQAAGEHGRLDARSDLYALGLILFELVTLRRAREGATMESVILKAFTGEIGPLVHLNPRIHIAAEMRAIIGRATARDPEQRYASVADLAGDLRRYRNGEAVRALPDNALRKAMRLISRHRATTLALLLSLLLASAGGILGLLLREARKAAAQRRHQAGLQSLSMVVSEHAHMVEGRLQYHAARLYELAGRATTLITRQRGRGKGAATHEEPARLYLSEDFDAQERAPADLEPNDRYHGRISLKWPVFKLAPGLDAAQARGDLETLSLLNPYLRAFFQESGGALFRLFVTLESGVHMAYPGRGGFPAAYDGRKRTKYLLVSQERVLRWGSPYPDLFNEPLVPCSYPLHDDEKRILGVVGFDLSMDEVAVTMLPVPGLAGLRASYLVNAEGQVLAQWPEGARQAAAREVPRSGQLHDNALLTLPLLPYPKVIEALRKERQGGHLELREQVVVYAPLFSLGWFLVVAVEPRPG